MSVKLTVPTLGESVSEAMIAQWFVKQGEHVAKDQPLCEIESDKVNVEIPAPLGGVLSRILKDAGQSVMVGETVAELEPGEGFVEAGGVGSRTGGGAGAATAVAEKTGGAAEAPGVARPAGATAEAAALRIGPAARRLIDEQGLDARAIKASGPGGRILKADVLQYLERRGERGTGPEVEVAGGQRGTGPEVERRAGQRGTGPEVELRAGQRGTGPEVELRAGQRGTGPEVDVAGGQRGTGPEIERTGAKSGAPAPVPQPARGEEPGLREERVRLTPFRRKVAERLVQAQQTAAILTTFNEVDMSAVTALRARHQDRFVQKYGVKLGFMSFFVKAAIDALKAYPGVNAEMTRDEIIYKHYYDIGVAVGGGRGLVVPVVRGADRLSFAELEVTIAELARKARENRLTVEDLSGGTFTISNGGIYGSLMSTPILNPPQTGILGMHKIQERPMAVDGQVVIRPMMYLALSYDHRVIDGREAVSFLIRVKECIEQPERMLLEV